MNQKQRMGGRAVAAFCSQPLRRLRRHLPLHRGGNQGGGFLFTIPLAPLVWPFHQRNGKTGVKKQHGRQEWRVAQQMRPCFWPQAISCAAFPRTKAGKCAGAAFATGMQSSHCPLRKIAKQIAVVCFAIYKIYKNIHQNCAKFLHIKRKTFFGMGIAFLRVIVYNTKA